MPSSKRNNGKIRESILAVLLLLLLLLLFWFLLRPAAQIPAVAPSPSPVVVAAPLPSPLPSPVITASVPVAKKQIPAPKRQGRYSNAYDFTAIERKLHDQRFALGECVVRNQNLASARMTLTLSWTGSGQLRDVALRPEPGPEVQNCVRDLVRQWTVAPHPGLQPFVYRTGIALAD